MDREGNGRTLQIVLAAAALPLVIAAAGKLLLKGAYWVKRKAYAALVLGLVGAVCYGLLLASALMEHRLLVALGYGAFAIIWLLWGFWQYGAKKGAEMSQD